MRSEGVLVAQSDAADLAGLRRVDWVRLIVNGDQLRAEVVGVGFRLPVSCPIPLSVAADLISRGTPHVTRAGDPVAP